MLSLKGDGYNRLYAAGRAVKIDEMLQKDGDYPDEVYLLIDRVRGGAPLTKIRVQGFLPQYPMRSPGEWAICMWRTSIP